MRSIIAISPENIGILEELLGHDFGGAMVVICLEELKEQIMSHVEIQVFNFMDGIPRKLPKSLINSLSG